MPRMLGLARLPYHRSNRDQPNDSRQWKARGGEVRHYPRMVSCNSLYLATGRTMIGNMFSHRVACAGYLDGISL
jgi:hypothetical protein